MIENEILLANGYSVVFSSTENIQGQIYRALHLNLLGTTVMFLNYPEIYSYDDLINYLLSHMSDCSKRLEWQDYFNHLKRALGALNE